jgi:hypothetical protein
MRETRAQTSDYGRMDGPGGADRGAAPKKGTKKGPKLMIAFLWECTPTSFPLGTRSIHKISRGTKSLQYQLFKQASMWSAQSARESPALLVRRLPVVFALISRAVSPAQAPRLEGPRPGAQSKAELAQIRSRSLPHTRTLPAISQRPWATIVRACGPSSESAAQRTFVMCCT